MVGSHLSQMLAKRGHEVICPVRRPIEIPGCRTIIESFEDNILCDLDEKVDIFVNNIGHISEHLSYDKLKSVNVDLQGKLVESAHRLGVKRHIQVSSVSVLGLGSKDSPITEDDRLGPGLGYGDSKRDGEKLTFNRCNELGIECVALRPTAIYGNSPKKGISEKIRMILKTPIRMIGSGKQKWHLVHVDDVCEACIQASNVDGIDGMSFLIAGPDPMTGSEIVKLACNVMDMPERGIRIPVWLAMGFVRVNTFLAFGKKPIATRMTISLLAGSHEYDISRARKYLGYEPKKYLRDELPSLLGA